MRKILFFAAAAVIAACTSNQKAEETEETEELVIPDFVISSVPDSLGYDPFYVKYTSVNGLPLVSSWRVPDSAFVAAHRTLYAMTSMLDKRILQKMIESNARVAIMARYEGTTDLPEHHYLVNDTSLNWDLRARGLGGDIKEPLTSCAEENLLAYQIDKYHAEDILIHEFAHAIHCIGIIQVDTAFNSYLETIYQQAKGAGILDGTYRITDKEEYFAEGVQDWFNVNAEMPKPDGKHNWCNTREELREYDYELYRLIERYFPKTNLQISKHPKINECHKP